MLSKLSAFVTRENWVWVVGTLVLWGGHHLAGGRDLWAAGVTNPLRAAPISSQVASHETAPADFPPADLPSRSWAGEGAPPRESAGRLETCCDNDCCGGCWYTPRLWAQADMLWWWTQGNRMPPLVTTSPDGTDRADAGVLDRPGTRVLHGGELVDGNGRLAARVNLGMWLDDCNTTAIEATWFILGDGGNSGNYYAQSIGDPVRPILARPFFNTQLNQQDAELIAFPDVINGDIQIETSSEMNSLSVLARRTCCQGPGGRFDVVGGYRYLRFREGLMITEDLTSIDDGNVVPVGTQFQLFDSFSTDNQFHGGEIGLSLLYDCGPWTLDVLTKLALGNMRQTETIRGSTTTLSPVDPPLTSEGGLLALPSNIGRSSRDEFTLIPELNLNLRYYWNPRLSTSVGYSLLWVTDIARTGDQIDFQVNPSQIPVNGGTLIGQPSPQRRLKDTSMWAQGLNFGVAWQY